MHHFFRRSKVNNLQNIKKPLQELYLQRFFIIMNTNQKLKELSLTTSINSQNVKNNINKFLTKLLRGCLNFAHPINQIDFLGEF